MRTAESTATAPHAPDTLERRLGHGRLPVEETLAIASSLLDRLAELHSHGVLHGEIRPATVLLERAPGKAGARFSTLTAAPAGDRIRIARYLAPEQAGLIDRPVDARSDLYAVGVLVYECLGGQPPFAAEGAGELLRQHLSAPVASLRRGRSDVPRALDEIVERLLRKDPEDRYQSARAALADIVAVGEDGVADGATGVVVGGSDLRPTLTEPALAGRRRELAILDHHLAAARGGSGTLIRVEAASGGGRSRLLDEFCRPRGAADVLVLRAGGAGRVARGSPQVLTDLAADLVRACAGEPELATKLRTRLAAHRTALCVTLPPLAEIFDAEDEGAAGENAAPIGGVRAAVALLNTLGDARRPALVVLDDCQWIDEPSARVLAAWAEANDHERPGLRHVLILAALRSDESTAPRGLTALRKAPRLRLEALGPADVRKMVVSMAGPVDPAAIELVTKLGRGNPFMVSAVLRGLIESDALVPGARGWRLDPAACEIQASGEAAALLARRLNLLDGPTRVLLTAGAVLGRAFEISLAASLAGQTRAAAERAVGQALNRRLVWREDPERYAIVHDRLREAILAHLPPHELARLHRLAGEKIAARDSSRAFELAHHFNAGGQPERALPHALAAGAAARSRGDFELAERQYRIAERGLDAGSEMRGRVAVAMGEVLMVRGATEEARARFELARAFTDDEIGIARIEGTLAEIAFRRDEVTRAFDHISTALRTLDCSLPAPRRSFLPRVAWEFFGRAVVPARWRRHRARGQEPDRRLLIAHLYYRLVFCSWYSRGGTLRVLWTVARQMNRAERCPPSPQLAQAHAVYAASLAAVLPFTWKWGLRHLDAAERLHRRFGDNWGLGQTLRMRAIVLCSAARYAEAEEAAERAAAVLARAGDGWNLNIAAGQRALCRYRVGDRRAAVLEARRIHERALEVGDAQAEAVALDVWARATDGRVPGKFIAAARERAGDDLYTLAALLLAAALEARAAGRRDEAIAILEEAAATMSRSRTHTRWTAPILPWLATLTREAAEAAPPFPRARRAKLRRARSASRRALRWARLYRAELPHALREAAMVASLSGRDRRGRRRFARSIEIAERQGALGEIDEARRLAEAAGWADPTEGVPAAAGEEWTRRPAAESTVAQADRFAALLRAGQRLVSAGSSEEIATAVEAAATTLLRSERCHVIGVGGSSVAEDDLARAAGAGLIERATERREPVIFAPPTRAGDAAEVGYRSALCAPILVGDEVKGHFLAVHSLVGDLFGADERKLAEFISRLAGSALERESLQQGRRSELVSAQESERSRIARDLHDEIGQALTSILLDVRSIENYVGVADWRPDQLRWRLEDLRGVGAAALDEVRRLAFELRPAVLDDIGLAAAVRRLVDDIGARHGLLVELASGDLGLGVRFSPASETTAYRVVQEALTNVVRHSGATRCSLVLARVGDRVRLVVGDDGAGFDVAKAAAGGLGIRGMRERAALVDGTLAVRSSPGEGTTLVLEVPIE